MESPGLYVPFSWERPARTTNDGSHLADQIATLFDLEPMLAPMLVLGKPRRRGTFQLTPFFP